KQSRKLRRGKVTSLECKRLSRRVSQSLELYHAALRRKRKPRVRLLLVINNLREQHFRNRRHAPAGHLFRIAHQFVEMNFRRRDKRADPPSPLHDSLTI